MKNKNKIILSIFVVGVITCGYLFFKKDNNNIQYITDSVKLGNITNTVLATGSVSAYQQVSVGAQVSGQIEKLNVKLGQSVKKGDLIAQIDSTTQKNDLETAKSNMNIYESQLKSKNIALNIAQTKYNRQLNLMKQNASSKEDLDDAKSNLALAKSDVDVLKSQIEQAKISVKTATVNLGYTQITAPLNGIIISIPVEEGQTVNSNQTTPTIVEIADLSKVIIKPEISEGDITKVKAGMPVDFSIIASPDNVFHTTLLSVDPGTTTLTDGNSSSSSSSSSSSTSSAIYYYGNMVVPNPNQELRISMTTQNTIIVDQVKNVLIVPTITISKENGKNYVSILNNNGLEEKREIKIGVSDSMNTQVISGIKKGEKIILSKGESGEIVSPMRRGPRI